MKLVLSLFISRLSFVRYSGNTVLRDCDISYVHWFFTYTFISTSLTSNNCLSRSENLVTVYT